MLTAFSKSSEDTHYAAGFNDILEPVRNLDVSITVRNRRLPYAATRRARGLPSSPDPCGTLW